MDIYRAGSKTSVNLTPRSGKDTAAPPGQKPGLSVSEAPPPGVKAQKIDPALLVAGLAYIPDDVDKGGVSGHGVITPVKPDGEVDQPLLEEWAASRTSSTIHRLTRAVLDSIIEHDVRSSS
jgi:hypothetical protein